MLTILTVPAEDQGAAVALGAMLDPQTGQFFAPAGVDLAVFRAWMPARPPLTAIAAPTRGLSLTELLHRVTAAVENAFPHAEWVRIEISSLTSRNGHMYLDAVDRDESGKELSKSRATIWRGQAEKLGEKFFKATGARLADGMKVLVLVQPQFKGQYGLSLNITDIDPAFTLGDMEARLKRIREKLDADGDANKNRSLPAPTDFSNVAVISPDGAAGLGDFQAEADRLTQAGLCSFTYFHAVFQGEKAKDSLKDAFIKAHKTHEVDPFDALVVIRGGGAAADLHWLNEYLIAKMVCRFHAPVFTGIGHERDSTILDEYAYRSFGTPSKVIGHIKEVIATKANKALEDWTSICQSVLSRLSAAEALIGKHHSDLVAGAIRQVDRAGFRTEQSYNDVQNNALSTLALVAQRVDGLHASVVDTAVSKLDAASNNIEHVSATINERALGVAHSIEISVKHNFDAITLAARRSIDGIEDHLNAYWGSTLDNANVVATNLAAESDRDFADVRYYARKMLDNAEADAKELMSGIMAHGIEPTLRRGFAIIKSEGKPISTKAAAAAQGNLEIMFRDGSLRVTKLEE
jgi:exodeoxyribonuclease VII large subunit